MAMGRQTTNVFGSIIAVAIIVGAYFGVAAPILNGKSANETELAEAKQLNSSYVQKLSQFSSDAQSPEVQKATASLEEFKRLVPGSIDIESASRAIADSLPSGVKLGSFNFGAAQQVSSLKLPEPSLSGFTAPTEFAQIGGEANSTTTSTGPNDTSSTSGTAPSSSGATSGFTRIPFTIEVTAGSYDELAEYLNQLSDQPRLISVVSVDSSRTETVSAKVYAFAFANS